VFEEPWRRWQRFLEQKGHEFEGMPPRCVCCWGYIGKLAERKFDAPRCSVRKRCRARGCTTKERLKKCSNCGVLRCPDCMTGHRERFH
jgi:hypothetical protein